MHDEMMLYSIAELRSSSSSSPMCKKEVSPWSACSASCGMGISNRISNDNADCQPVQQRRLCLVRLCEFNDRDMVSIEKSKHRLLRVNVLQAAHHMSVENKAAPGQRPIVH